MTETSEFDALVRDLRVFCVELIDRIEALTAARKEDYRRLSAAAADEAHECGVHKSRAEAAEKELQEMQAHIDHADAYHKAMLAAETERDALQADNARLLKGCECAMSEIRDYMQEVGGTLPLELAMGWLSTLDTEEETK